ncbi:FAST kinase domain-containing protein 1, mitochondrial isoform X2 [Antennarius striatus]|uniref:FAST kinase domain-containing protein 1, mitochondrial isoform X2 n=1 Tax=Antennarius striatus TaxID=241820 RepID=UPI0035B46E71
MMFRLRSVNSCLRRALSGGTVNTDPVMEQLQACAAEDQVLDLVGKNESKLTEHHVSLAVDMLWQFQKVKPVNVRAFEFINNHPHFATLRVLAESKIAYMTDLVLVDMLYNLIRLEVEPHDPVVQQLVSEAWLRIDGLSMAALSKFATSLKNQQLLCSTVMGQITNIVAQKLSLIDDIKILATFMYCLSYLVSPRLRDALIVKATHLLDLTDDISYTEIRKVVGCLHNTKHRNWDLLKKCDDLILFSIPKLGDEKFFWVVRLIHSTRLFSCDTKLAVKQRLTDLFNSEVNVNSSAYLFAYLVPMANQELRTRFENWTFMFTDELSSMHALDVLEALENINCSNIPLLQKITSVIQSNLHLYTVSEVARVTAAFTGLRYQNQELSSKLQNLLSLMLQHSFSLDEIFLLIRAMSALPCPQFDKRTFARLNALLPQCNLQSLKYISLYIKNCMKNDFSYHIDTPSKCAHLLENLHLCGLQRVRTHDRLDYLLNDLRLVSGEWFNEVLLEETVAKLQGMIDQINWTNVHSLADTLTRMNHPCSPLLDRIASVVLKDFDKIHYMDVYRILLLFSVLNYDPPQADELYDACIQLIVAHIDSYDLHRLISLAHTLAVTNHFPEKLIRRIFSIQFLGKLETLLPTLSAHTNLLIRRRLMELNRATCLDCPEFQVQWFHDSYFQQMNIKGVPSVDHAEQQILKILGEVLGGGNRVRSAVVTPYFYTINYECILDRDLHPLPYSEPNIEQISHTKNFHWRTRSLQDTEDELPLGAQRVALDFLNSKSFCWNARHMKGCAQMRRRHLEVLGYQVVEIPWFEWNSMELSTQEARKDYMRKKIFKEGSSGRIHT